LTRAWADLFFIRIAGNIVAPSQIGSIEFAAERFGTQLVVVLGHSQCGAVLATLEALESPNSARSSNLLSIVDRIRPAVEPLFASATRPSADELISSAVKANIRASVEQLNRGSRILQGLMDKGELTIVGAEYSLETGVVDVFDGLSLPGAEQVAAIT